jgi:hypothetical protein
MIFSALPADLGWVIRNQEGGKQKRPSEDLGGERRSVAVIFITSEIHTVFLTITKG